MLTSSQYTLHSRNSSCGWVSWKYSPPISSAGMCAAMASTGTPLRLASNRPLIRCRLPGPQLAAHTASSPVSAASPAAANLSRSKIVNRSWWRLVATKLVRVPSWAGWRGGYGGRGAGGVRECAARPPCRAAAFSA